MTEKRKKGTGYEAVKEYVLDRLRRRTDKSFLRIAGEEIARAVGISPQMVNRYVRELVRERIFHRERRCYYGEARSVPSVDRSVASEPLTAACESSADCTPVPFTAGDVSPANSVMIPTDDLRGTFIDVSGKKYYVFRSSAQVSRTVSGNVPTSFPKISETGDFNVPETSTDVRETSEAPKKELQEIQNKKTRTVNELGDYVDCKEELYLRIQGKATAMFNRYGAGVKRGTNQYLINRFVAGCRLDIPLIDFEELESQLKQAEKEYREYESWSGFGKRTGIPKPFVRIARYLKICFEAAGWTWTKLTPPLEQRAKAANRNRQPVPPRIDGEVESLPVPSCLCNDKDVSAAPPTPPSGPGASPPENRPADGKRSIPPWIGKMIDESGIGRMPSGPSKPPPPNTGVGGQ